MTEPKRVFVGAWPVSGDGQVFAIPAGADVAEAAAMLEQAGIEADRAAAAAAAAERRGQPFGPGKRTLALEATVAALAGRVEALEAEIASLRERAGA